MVIFFPKKKNKNPLTAALAEIKEDCKKRLQAVPMPGEKSLSREEQKLLRNIRSETERLNANNITRTKAYLDFYWMYPEIHWAFLAHMISRNGGWNMTDLRGELHSRLLNEEKRQAFFSFLERGNWLIFQDAYPQLLLFMESKRRSKSLFYLLPYLNVSTFMEVIWNYYWRKGGSVFLTFALIINEQSYLEQRVIQDPLFKERVFQTLAFVVQDLLSASHLLFPFDAGPQTERTGLIGLTLHHFSSLHERIRLGKQLYRLLFQDKSQLGKVVNWAARHRHTGSRKDYWPYLFNDVNEDLPGSVFTKRLQACRLREGAARLYSPSLAFAWANARHSPAEPGDWFEHLAVIDYLQEEHEEINGEITDEYCKTLETLQLAAAAKKAIFS
ncbi:DUF2515 family protein [Bacillus badius]|uniref:DUF2515 domain-containing protein n=1 Tax=Bacillus badius TaxID=1455 RepID=A0ABR5APY9_BACBA|nr:DUF2515 family protein [Bacillus badius]KIL75887.1 putative protein YppC [Bacillus badius]MED4717025.1 DUF2515 family protein [Bacillus badius]